LNDLQKKFAEKGFNVLAFPCNQFGLQENSSNDEILNVIKYVRPGNGFEVTFPIFQLVKCNGEDASEAYKFLTKTLPEKDNNETYKHGNVWITDQSPIKLTTTPVKAGEVEWNFEKFLVDTKGKPVARFTPKTKFEDIEKAIENLLK